MKRERAARKTLNVPQTLTAFKWCEKHKDELATVSRAEAIAWCFADTGVHIPALRMVEIEEDLGIDRRRPGGNTLSKAERNIIASELVRLMESLGFAPDPKLKAMVGG